MVAPFQCLGPENSAGGSALINWPGPFLLNFAYPVTPPVRGFPAGRGTDVGPSALRIAGLGAALRRIGHISAKRTLELILSAMGKSIL